MASLTQVWQSLYHSVKLSLLRWVLSVSFLVLYSLFVITSAVVVCWAVFVWPLPSLLTVIASIEQVCCVLAVSTLCLLVLIAPLHSS